MVRITDSVRKRNITELVHYTQTHTDNGSIVARFQNLVDRNPLANAAFSGVKPYQNNL